MTAWRTQDRDNLQAELLLTQSRPGVHTGQAQSIGDLSKLPSRKWEEAGKAAPSPLPVPFPLKHTCTPRSVELVYAPHAPTPALLPCPEPPWDLATSGDS